MKVNLNQSISFFILLIIVNASLFGSSDQLAMMDNVKPSAAAHTDVGLALGDIGDSVHTEKSVSSTDSALKGRQDADLFQTDSEMDDDTTVPPTAAALPTLQGRTQQKRQDSGYCASASLNSCQSEGASGRMRKSFKSQLAREKKVTVLKLTNAHEALTEALAAREEDKKALSDFAVVVMQQRDEDRKALGDFASVVMQQNDVHKIIIKELEARSKLCLDELSDRNDTLSDRNLSMLQMQEDKIDKLKRKAWEISETVKQLRAPINKASVELEAGELVSFESQSGSEALVLSASTVKSQAASEVVEQRLMAVDKQLRAELDTLHFHNKIFYTTIGLSSLASIVLTIFTQSDVVKSYMWGRH